MANFECYFARTSELLRPFKQITKTSSAIFDSTIGGGGTICTTIEKIDLEKYYDGYTAECMKYLYFYFNMILFFAF